MKMKRILSWLLTAAMIMTLLPCFTLTASAEGESISEVRYSTDGGSTWNEDSLMNALWSCYSSQNVKIELLRDITLDSGWYAQQDLGYNGATWTVDGNGYTIKRSEGAKMLFCVRYGSNVTLSDIVIDGGAVWDGDDPATRKNTGLSLEGNNAHLIYVDGGATLTLNDGVILQNSDLGATSYGAAVVVGYSDAGNGKLVMNDGVIIRNNRAESGGAILVMNSGDQFVMNGGTITGNYATAGGGAVCVSGGSFVMKGGEISGNASGNNGGGVTVIGEFTLEDGVIKNNKSDAGGGGVTALTGDVILQGGEISGNSITGKMGGGVLVHSGTLTVSGTPKVIGNTINGATASNIYLNNKIITVSAALTEGAELGVTTATAPSEGSSVSITDASGADYSKYFVPDSRSCIVESSAGNGLIFSYVEPTYIITFDANGGTGTMEAVTGVSGEYTLPWITTTPFTAPEGMEFKGWEVDGTVYAENAVIDITADTTVKAVWAIPAEIQIQNTLVYSSEAIGYQLDEKITRYWKNGDSGTFTGTADDYNMKIEWSTRNGKDVATITLKGANTVDTDNTNYGLLVLANNTFEVDLVIEEDSTLEQITVYSCDVNISGDGKLIGHDTKTNAQNIYVDGDLTISGANISAQSLDKVAANVIFATGDLIIDNSVVDIASGSDWGSEYNFAPLRCSGTMTIRNGSNVSVTCIDGTTCHSVVSGGDLIIEDSTVTVVNNGTNRGISAGKDLYIKETANGTTNVTVDSNGIALAARSGKLMISGGTVDLTSAANNAMRANDIEITGGTVEAKSSASNCIYCDGNIVISGSANVDANASSTAIVAVGSLSISGTADVKASGQWSLWSKANNIAISGGTVEAISTSYAFVSKPDLANYTNSVVFAGADANTAAIIVDPAGTAYHGMKYVRIQPGYVIVFDANGGTMTGDSVLAADADGKLAALPADPSYTGYTFNGWFDAVTGGNPITTDTVFDAKTTVYAQWEEITYDVWVGGTQLKELNKNDVFGDGKVKFDTDTNTLTLNGYSYEGDECGISTELDELNIVLIGANSITNTDGFAIDAGEGAVTISGNGELTAVGGIASGNILIVPLEDMFVFVTADDSANVFDEESDITELVSGATSVKMSLKRIGDLNGDGEITNADIIILARYLVGLVELSEEQLQLADVKADGVIRNSDLVRIVRIIVEA